MDKVKNDELLTKYGKKLDKIDKFQLGEELIAEAPFDPIIISKLKDVYDYLSKDNPD